MGYRDEDSEEGPFDPVVEDGVPVRHSWFGASVSGGPLRLLSVSLYGGVRVPLSLSVSHDRPCRRRGDWRGEERPPLPFVVSGEPFVKLVKSLSRCSGGI